MEETNKNLRVALIGNPNCGKSTLFNMLTGLNQKIGNFPGVTVDKRIGYFNLQKGSEQRRVELIDLPGTYSLFPKSMDEEVAVNILKDAENALFPDLTIVIADASNLKRSLILCTQVIDLQIPMVLVLNMIDLAEKSNILIDINKLSEELGIEVIAISASRNINIDALRNSLWDVNKKPKKSLFKNIEHQNTNAAQSVKSIETQERFKIISSIIQACVKYPVGKGVTDLSKKLDKIFTHKFWGFFIFLTVLFFVFQAIFNWSTYPMDYIEMLFLKLAEFVGSSMPPGTLNDLVVNGIISGLSGIAVFIPQIGLLFAFIAILEDTGYMARVSFIMDRMLRKFGLNGRSIIPLISGVACAVPAVMGARTISNTKERIITIMVTPLMSCSARLPVYTLLIALVVPSDSMLGMFNLQGMVFMFLYLIGFIAAISVAWILKRSMKTTEESFFIMEMPVYRMPRWHNVGLTMLEKIKVFLLETGKIIIAISIILWVLSSYGPGNNFEKIDSKYAAMMSTDSTRVDEFTNQMNAEKLEASYAGMLGKAMEPAIAPLGFDWKIGISLVTSFAAREVFVGTMSTIYSVGDQDNTLSVREKMAAEINPATGKARYTFAVGFSLMLFYAFAMQCMSTVAAVYRETKSWKWPTLQFAYLSVLAYLASFIAYNLFK